MSVSDNNGRPIVRCYNEPALPHNLQARYSAEGLFVADYGSGRSLDSADVNENNRSAAGNAFNRIVEISQKGGFGTIRTNNDDDAIIAVGEWMPNCIRFEEFDGKTYKGIQMAQFGLFVPQDGEIYERLDALYNTSGATVVSKPKDAAVIQTAIDLSLIHI